MTSPLDIARDYTARGWSLIPLKDRSKNPAESIGKGWEKLRLGLGDLPLHFNGHPMNLGGLLGEPSGGLVDIDLDTAEAIAVADTFFPETDAEFGRKSKPRSHRLYISREARNRKFQFSYRDADGKRKAMTLLEVRGSNPKQLQTVLPGSTHPSGEAIAWNHVGEPAEIEAEILDRAAHLAATAALLVRFWPDKASPGDGGCRHDASLALAGGLRRSGVPLDDALHIMRCIAAGTGAENIDTKLGNVRDTYAKGNDTETTGWKRLGELIGEDVVKTARKWLGGQRAADEREAGPDALILDPADPYPAAQMFIGHHYTLDGARTIHEQSGVFYAYQGASYAELEDAGVRADLWTFAAKAQRPTKDGELVPFQPNSAKIGNIMDAARAAAHLPATNQSPCWLDGRAAPKPAEVIAFNNGLLHVPTRDLIPPTPQFYTHNALPIGWDAKPGDEPVLWLRFLRQLWPDDESAIMALQEMFGYLLLPDTSQQKLFLVVGPKRSGKGTIARVLTTMLGQANVCGPTLASLSTNFGLAPLVGKMLAIISDARLSARADQAAIAERLLAISGEDGITIDRKFLPAWTGRLPTRFLILSNELPRLADASGALASRFVVFTLRTSFYGHEDPALTDKLLAELPGILRWAMDGWDRLHERGHFTTPDSSLEAVQELEDLGSPIGAFIRERCIVEAGQTVEAGVLFNAWRTWCESEGRDHPGTKQTFGRDLRAAVPGLRVSRPRTAGESRLRWYEGISLAE